MGQLCFIIILLIFVYIGAKYDNIKNMRIHHWYVFLREKRLKRVKKRDSITFSIR